MELMGEYSTTLVIDTLEIKKSTFYRHLNKRKTSVDASNERKERNRGREEKELNQELLREIRTILKGRLSRKVCLYSSPNLSSKSTWRKCLTLATIGTFLFHLPQ